VIVAIHAGDSGTPAPVPASRVRRIPQEPAGRSPEPARGLNERALGHARRAAAQAPPLRPGTAGRVRQIIFGAGGSPAPTGRKAG